VIDNQMPIQRGRSSIPNAASRLDSGYGSIISKQKSSAENAPDTGTKEHLEEG
jgi:hypothetical protein